jgi:hypothetical protein
MWRALVLVWHLPGGWIELMKGQIGVESALGLGSTFWIELPATESQLRRLQRTGGTGSLPALTETPRTILYIEDNIANFELVQQVLTDYGQIELLWATDLEDEPDTSASTSPQPGPAGFTFGRQRWR